MGVLKCGRLFGPGHLGQSKDGPVGGRAREEVGGGGGFRVGKRRAVLNDDMLRNGWEAASLRREKEYQRRSAKAGDARRWSGMFLEGCCYEEGWMRY